jgi:hypothetical protein
MGARSGPSSYKPRTNQSASDLAELARLVPPAENRFNPGALEVCTRYNQDVYRVAAKEEIQPA